MTVSAPEKAELGLSIRMREGSMAEHKSAETRPFIEALLDTRINALGYCEYLRRFVTVYDALEEAGRALATHRVVGRIVSDRLDRRPSLDADLAFWSQRDGGVAVSDEPSPAAEAYAARIRATLDVPELYIAHHYTRYMGDLSGGQAIGSKLAREFKLEGNDGVAFYEFAQIAKPKLFKDDYRSTLDQLELSEAQKVAIIDEVRGVFQLNEAIFDELGASLATYLR